MVKNIQRNLFIFKTFFSCWLAHTILWSKKYLVRFDSNFMICSLVIFFETNRTTFYYKQNLSHHEEIQKGLIEYNLGLKNQITLNKEYWLYYFLKGGVNFNASSIMTVNDNDCEWMKKRGEKPMDLSANIEKLADRSNGLKTLIYKPPNLWKYWDKIHRYILSMYGLVISWYIFLLFIKNCIISWRKQWYFVRET